MRTGSMGQLGRVGEQRGRPRVEIGVGGQGSADGGYEVCVQEARSTSRMSEGRGRESSRCREELELQVRIVVARAAGRAGAVEEALASEEIGGVCPPGDIHDAVLILCQQVEPPRQVMAHVALLLMPLEARVVSVQLEGLVQQVGSNFRRSALRACTTSKSSNMWGRY